LAETEGIQPGGPLGLTLVIRTAAGLYRHHLLRVVVAALVVFAPVDLLEKVVEDLTNEFGSELSMTGVAVTVASVCVVGISLIAEILYAGVLDYTVGATLDGAGPPSVRSIFLRLPYGRLLGAELLAAVIIIVGFLLAVVPGLVALTLFSITGPVVILEGRGPIAAIRRSVELLVPRWRLAALAVTLPLVGASVLQSVVAALLGGWLPTTLVVNIVFDVTVFAFAGLMIAVLGHRLVNRAAEPVHQSPVPAT
jgi:hypothetical protein